MLLAGRGQRSVETLVVRESEVVDTLGAESKAGDGLVLESGLVGHGVRVLLTSVASDVIHRVGVGKSCLGIGVGYTVGPYKTKLTDTVGRTIAEHVDDTACAHVVTTCTLVATIGYFGVELEGKIGENLGLELGVDVGTAYT